MATVAAASTRWAGCGLPPSALLPSAALRWSEVDDERARATLALGRLAASVDFVFDAAGDCVGVAAERWCRGTRGYERLPWRVELSEHAEASGLRVPHAARVAWVRDGTAQAVWTGRLTAIDFEFSAPR